MSRNQTGSWVRTFPADAHQSGVVAMVTNDYWRRRRLRRRRFPSPVLSSSFTIGRVFLLNRDKLQVNGVRLSCNLELFKEIRSVFLSSPYSSSPYLRALNLSPCESKFRLGRIFFLLRETGFYRVEKNAGHFLPQRFVFVKVCTIKEPVWVLY